MRPSKANLNQPGPHASRHAGSPLRAHKQFVQWPHLINAAAIPLRMLQTSLSRGFQRASSRRRLLFGEV
jgi:hypothetical protein